MNKPITLDRKEIIISNYGNKKLAKIKNSSFLISALGKSDDEATENLNNAYKHFVQRLENCD